MYDPWYYRARIATLVELVSQQASVVASSSNNKDRLYQHQLRNGFIAEDEMVRFNELVQRLKPKTSPLPLHPLEIHRYDTWFAMHPEKIAGTQVASTSYSFPVITKGTEADIRRVIESGIRSIKKPAPDPTTKKAGAVHSTNNTGTISKLKLKAKAAKAKLLLLEL